MNDLFGALKPLGLLEAVAGMSRPATLAELADYLQARITQYDTAKPIDACPACVPE